MKIKIVESTFKDKPILNFYDEEAKEEYRDKPILSIGYKKCRIILSCIDAIKKFVEKNQRR